MFIYIGNDEVIESDKIISILNYQLTYSSPKLRQLIADQKRNKRVIGSDIDAKSIIITDESIYYSSFSTSTLKNREELYATMNQVEKR
ncbi:extracellular matrix regulator RemB [Pseudogracilibacillus sp. SO30301A]|uniref:extracellular matrix regulator RemB n=1 Tax=Pseudogracilibacillus sp. SO30301A TaxID=3098291 RepID=UPI00300DF938